MQAAWLGWVFRCGAQAKGDFLAWVVALREIHREEQKAGAGHTFLDTD